MGLFTSKTKKEISMDEVPRFASLYNSWIGYLAFLWQLLLVLMAFTMLTGYWQSSSTVVLLAFVIISFVFYMVFFWLNSAWYGATFASRMYWEVNKEECVKICKNIPDYDKITERDLKFHNDQWHFSVGLGAYFFILIFLAVFLGVTVGSANPVPDINTPNPIYTPATFANFIIIKFFHALVIGVAGLLSLILFYTHACFIHSHLISLYRQLKDLDVATLRTPKEYDHQPGQISRGGDTAVVVETKGTTALQYSLINRNYL